MTTNGRMRVFILFIMMSLVCGSYPSGGAINNPWDGGFGEQVVQQSLEEPQPPNSVSGQYWAQQQQLQQQQHHQHHMQQQQIHFQGDAEIPTFGICTAPVCPASSVCVHRQLCHNGLLITDGSVQVNQQIPIISLARGQSGKSCGSNMICCGVPSCNQQVKDDLASEPSNIYTVTARPPRTYPPVVQKPTTMMMNMMMGPMRFPGNCSAGLYCIERSECDRNGFVINNPNQHVPGADYLPRVPLLSCEERRGNIQDGVCCQQVHPNPQGFDKK